LNSPFFSVIIPLYNKEKYIKSTLDSVFNQSFKNFEIIIVDDGSLDNSLAVIKEYNSSKIKIFSQDNSGPSVARNLGIEKAIGNFTCFLDADDYWCSDHLANFKDSINKYPLEKVFCNNYKIKFSEKSLKKATFSYLPDFSQIVLIKNYFKSSMLYSIATSSSICIESQVIKNNKFDTTLLSGQDTDLWIRLGLKYSYIFNKNTSFIYDKSVPFSLSKSNNSTLRFPITQKFIREEKNNIFLKRLMDNIRFSLIIKFRLENNKEKINLLTRQIENKNLNYKQIILLYMPSIILKKIFIIKQILDKTGIYFYLYK